MAHSGNVWPGLRQSGMDIAQWGASKPVYCDMSFACDKQTEDQCDQCGRDVCENHSSTRFAPGNGWVMRICHVCEPIAQAVPEVKVVRLPEWIPYFVRLALFKALERVS